MIGFNNRYDVTLIGGNLLGSKFPPIVYCRWRREVQRSAAMVRRTFSDDVTGWLYSSMWTVPPMETSGLRNCIWLLMFSRAEK